MSILSAIFFLALTGAVVAVVAAAALASRRGPLLFLAAGMFGVAGVLGILSIGVVFLAAALLCVVVAARSDAPRRANGPG